MRRSPRLRRAVPRSANFPARQGHNACLIGLDCERLTYRHVRQHHRLTDVVDKVVRGVLA